MENNWKKISFFFFLYIESGDDVICVVCRNGIDSPVDHLNHYALDDDKFNDWAFYSLLC